MGLIKNNHEIWAVCPVCGTEYDRRVWGDTCPRCADRRRRTADEIKRRRNGTERDNR